MHINTDTNTLEIMIPIAGTPLPFFFANRGGNNLSFAIAKGIWPCIKIYPFKAPNAAMAAPALTRYLALVPQTISAASAKGVTECCKFLAGIIPMILILLMI